MSWALATKGINIIRINSNCFFILVFVLKLVFNKGLAVPLVVDGEVGRRGFPCISVRHKRGFYSNVWQRYINFSTSTRNHPFFSVFYMTGHIKHQSNYGYKLTSTDNYEDRKSDTKHRRHKKLIMITYIYQISLVTLTFLAKNLVITISLFH